MDHVVGMTQERRQEVDITWPWTDCDGAGRGEGVQGALHLDRDLLSPVLPPLTGAIHLSLHSPPEHTADSLSSI